MAQPARHSERAEKLYPPAIQSSASLHNGRGSNRRWMKVQWQVSLKRASKQFSKNRPAVIWGHFLGLDEGEMRILLERNIKERNALDFGEYLFRSENRNHVARLRLSADGDIRIGTSHRGQIAYGGGPAYDLTSRVSRFDGKLLDESYNSDNP